MLFSPSRPRADPPSSPAIFSLRCRLLPIPTWMRGARRREKSLNHLAQRRIRRVYRILFTLLVGPVVDPLHLWQLVHDIVEARAHGCCLCRISGRWRRQPGCRVFGPEIRWDSCCLSSCRCSRSFPQEFCWDDEPEAEKKIEERKERAQG